MRNLAVDHTFYVFTGVITHAGCWENTSVRPTSQVRYHTGKPIESVVYCFYKITISKTENVSVFYEFTGTINHRFLTNQNARTILVIL